MKLRQKIQILEKLYEVRDKTHNKPRFGVKPRWNGNPLTFFRDLKEYLHVTNYGKIDNLKRSVINENS